ncbi:MAG TPA: WYL domain-containing transcriptional regulator [Pirellulales bacterium]|nr:WYL domain-containing transcriptional regulator [Pirellulales bacterium]
MAQRKHPNNLPSERVERGRSDAARRENQAQRLARVLRLLELLNHLHGYSLRELAEDLKCGERTVRRYLMVLKEAGYEWRFDKNRKCYELISELKFRLPVTRLSDEELLGQVVAGVISSAPGLEPARGAQRTTSKLAAQLGAEVAAGQAAIQILSEAERLVGVVNLPLADHSCSQNAMRAAQRALLARQQVAGTYSSPHKSRPEKLRLHPYRLCLVKQAWYLIARPVDADRPKTYRIARFNTLEMLDAPADVPHDFDARDYFGNAWAVYRGERTYDVEIVFSKEAAPLVLKTVWHPTQRATRRDGKVTLTFQVDGLDEIVHWVLGWSGRAKVVRPKELREMVVEHLRKALALNTK